MVGLISAFLHLAVLRGAASGALILLVAGVALASIKPPAPFVWGPGRSAFL